MEKISVLILVQNSEFHLKRCLDSLTRFDEIVVVDGGSSDGTIDLAKKYENVKVYENKWPGFIEQRNFSISKASHKWCFMMDSDEMATPELVEEIIRIVNNSPDKALYNICRTEFFLGEAIDIGHGKSDWQERLFLKDRVSYTGGNHHKHLIDGELADNQPEKIGYINRDFRVLHDETYGLSDWVKKVPRFTILIASEKFERGKRVGAFEVLMTLFYTFFQIYYKSWRLGKVGFVISVQTAIFRGLVKLLIYEKTKIGFSNRMSYKDQYLG